MIYVDPSELLGAAAQLQDDNYPGVWRVSQEEIAECLAAALESIIASAIADPASFLRQNGSSFREALSQKAASTAEAISSKVA